MLILVAVVVAFAVRVLFVILQWRGAVDAPPLADDSFLYLSLARNLSSGLGMSESGHPTAYVAPGYPLFLVPLTLLGVTPFGIGIVQAGLGALTVGLTGLLAVELTRPRELSPTAVAAIAAFGAALYPHLVFWTGFVLTETLFVCLVAAALLSTAISVRTGSGRWAVVAGLTSSAAALTRPPYLAVAVLIVAWLLVAMTLRRVAAIVPVAFALALAVPVGAWTVRNLLELGAPVVTSTESGFVMYQGNARGASGGTNGYIDRRDWPALDLPPDLDEAGRDRAYLARALADAADDPLAVFLRWPAKLWNMWRPTYEGASPRNLALSLITYPPVLAAGFIGAALLARRDPFGSPALPFLFVMAWITVHVLAIAMIRFRVPAELILIAAAPAFVDALVARSRGR